MRQREAVLTAAPPPPPAVCPRGLAVPPHGALCRPSEARLSPSRGREGPPCPDVAGWPDGHSALRRSSDSVSRPPRPDGGLRPETVPKPLGAAGQRLGGEAQGRAVSSGARGLLVAVHTATGLAGPSCAQGFKCKTFVSRGSQNPWPALAPDFDRAPGPNSTHPRNPCRNIRSRHACDGVLFLCSGFVFCLKCLFLPYSA